MRCQLLLRRATFTVAAFVSFASLAGWLEAQSLPAPKITHVTPAGGQAGTTVEVTVAGADIDKAEGLHFSFPGAKVEVVAGPEKVVTPDPKKKGAGMKGPAPQVSQKFKVTLPALAPVGIHDVRIVTKAGVSNPRAFVIGDLKEFVEEESNEDVPKAQKITLNSTVNGVILTPTDVDYYRFSGEKGQRVIVSCLTSSIDSKLPAQLQVYGASEQGKYLGFNKSYQNNDALLDVTLPETGDYVVRVCSFTYTQGGLDYFYRLTVSTAPWIDAAFPPVVEPGKETKITLYGRNLPKGVADATAVVDGRVLDKLSVSVKAPSDPKAIQRLAFSGLITPLSAGLDGFEYRVASPTGQSNPQFLQLAPGPIVLDAEPNDTLESAQKIGFPCTLAGRIDKKGDRDWYAFPVKKGQVVCVEAYGDRLGSAMDLYFVLRDLKGATLIEQDDNPEITSPQFYTRSDDPARYRLVAPSEGTLYLQISSRDAFIQHGPRSVYTVRIGPDEPDFQVVAMPVNPIAPDSVVVGQAGHQAYQAFVLRSGGFTGDVVLSGEQLPPGVTMKPQVIAGNQKVAGFVVSAAPEAPPYVGPIKVTATAVLEGKRIVREVRAATITWPLPQQVQNTPTITRLDRELVLAVRDKAPFRLQVDKDKITVLQGEKISVPLKVSFAEYKGNVQVTAVALPVGMVLQPITLAPGKEAATATFDSKTTVLPGNYTIVLRGQTNAPGPKPAPKPGVGPVNLVQAAPPINLIVVPKQLAKVSTGAAAVKVPAGKDVEVAVKVARQFEYSGSYKVEAIIPATAKGVKAEPVTIKSGEDDAKLVIRADTGAAGQSATLTIRVTAMFNDTPVVHETKLTVNVTK